MELEKPFESPLDCTEIQPVNPKGNQSWIFIERTDAEAETPNTLATWWELTHWKRPWCWARLKAGEEGYDRGWDGWMASLTRWTWVWASSGSWWRTGKPGMLQSMGLQKVGHDWVTELIGTELNTVKGFDIVNKAEVDIFLEFSCFFDDPISSVGQSIGVSASASVLPMDIQECFPLGWMLAIWSLVPLPFLNPAWASGNSWLTYSWSLAWRILSITLLVCEMSAVVW